MTPKAHAIFLPQHRTSFELFSKQALEALKIQRSLEKIQKKQITFREYFCGALSTTSGNIYKHIEKTIQLCFKNIYLEIFSKKKPHH